MRVTLPVEGSDMLEDGEEMEEDRDREEDDDKGLEFSRA